MTLTKIDLKRERRELFGAKRTPALVEVPPIGFLMIDGHGAPGGPEFRDSVGALYTMSYTLKFQFKQDGRADWVVAPLEGLWWTQGHTGLELGADPSTMSWRLMIAQPDDLVDDDVEEARATASRKREISALSEVRFRVFEEGTSAQILHVGPYADEPATIVRLQAFIAEQGLRSHGLHHEVYLSDPSRTPAPKLRTILRQPVRS